MNSSSPFVTNEEGEGKRGEPRLLFQPVLQKIPAAGEGPDISGLKEVVGSVAGESLGPSGANGTLYHGVFPILWGFPGGF